VIGSSGFYGAGESFIRIFYLFKMSYYDTHWYLENEQILVPACLDPIVQIQSQRRVDADPWVKKAIIALKTPLRRSSAARASYSSAI